MSCPRTNCTKKPKGKHLDAEQQAAVRERARNNYNSLSDTERSELNRQKNSRRTDRQK